MVHMRVRHISGSFSYACIKQLLLALFELAVELSLSFSCYQQADGNMSHILLSAT